MIEMKTLECDHCETSFEREAKDWRYQVKCGAEKFFCSSVCNRANSYCKKDIICDECGNHKTIPNKDYLKSKSGFHFCSHSCRAVFFNKKKVHVTSDAGKELICIDCNITFTGSKYSKLRGSRCEDCKLAKIKSIATTIKIAKELVCINCKLTMMSITNKSYCDDCLRAVHHNIGSKNFSIKDNRSKNEILFCETIRHAFPEYNITANEQFFVDKHGGKWDADVIIHDLKIAIHWNGNWHYAYCGGSHSVAQVQSRDKIKHKLVLDQGYTNYVIEDRGKYNKKKVEEEIEKILIYIKMIM